MSGTEKRSLTIAGHRTSVALEPAFWQVLGEIARARGLSLARLIGNIDQGRAGALASALRLHALDHLRRKTATGSR